jgi:hypothetical protein
MDKIINNIANEEEDFNFFLSNLKNVSYFNKGTFGLTFILELKDDIKSPYQYTDGTQIKKVLLKLVGICTLENRNTKTRMTTYRDEKFISYNSETLTANAVEKECRMQKKVYDCGKEKNIQLCPKMFYCDIKSIENATQLLDTLIKSTGYVKPQATVLNKLKSIVKHPNPPPLAYNILDGLKQNISLIDELSFSLMEYADGYNTLSSYSSTNKEDYARVALLKLALYCGVSHSDPNKGNILINNNNHILLIDFGSTIDEHDKDVITEEEKTQIINNLKEHKYYNALELCNKFYTSPTQIPHSDPIEPQIAWVHKGIISKPNPIIDSFVTNELIEKKGGKTNRRQKTNRRRLRKTQNKKRR